MRYKLALICVVFLIYSCKSADEDKIKEIEMYNDRFDQYYTKLDFDSASIVASRQILIDTTNPLGYFNKGMLMALFFEKKKDSARIYLNHSVNLVDRYKKNDRYWSIRADAKVYLNALDTSINKKDIPRIDSVVINYKALESKKYN